MIIHLSSDNDDMDIVIPVPPDSVVLERESPLDPFSITIHLDCQSPHALKLIDWYRRSGTSEVELDLENGGHKASGYVTKINVFYDS